MWIAGAKFKAEFHGKPTMLLCAGEAVWHNGGKKFDKECHCHECQSGSIGFFARYGRRHFFLDIA